MQKGSAQILLIAFAVILILAGVFYFSQKISKNDLAISPQVNPPTETINTHTDQNLGFELSYSSEMTLKKDTEEEFNKRGNGDFRKNFKGYVGYEPGRFLGAVVVLEKEGNYETNPFTVWLFDNPDELSIDKWHHDFWYYPFVWGDFTSEGKFIRAPQKEATFSGQTGKSGIIEYQPGKPKFVYINYQGKMYLFRIIGDEGDQILNTVKFLN